MATVGATAAAIVVALVSHFEGYRNVGYLDDGGIATKCFGDTKGAVVGQHYTEADCLASLDQQLIAHSQGVLRCVPGLQGHANQLAAATSFAYNVGVSGFCGSSVARLFRQGNLLGGCAGMSAWTHVKGKVSPGLVRRRAAERELCERGL